MKRHYLKHQFEFVCIVFLLICSSGIHAHGSFPDSLVHGPFLNELNSGLSLQSLISDEELNADYLFPELEESIAAYEMMEMAPPEQDNLPQFLVQIGNGKLSAKVKKAKEIVDKALEIGNQIDLLTGGDLVKMPIYKTQEIGQTVVTIVFNSATIHPQYAVIQVFAKIELPHKDFDDQPVVLYFGANEIYFSQDKGIIKGSIGLIADFSFKIGDTDPKAGIWLEKMIKSEQPIDPGDPNTPLDDEYGYTGTYINFDCEGFKEMGVGGRVYFSRDWVLPADEFGVPLEVPNDTKSETPRTWGWFQFTAQDWNDILVEANIADPFVLTKWQDMSFMLRNAYLDLSSYRNPSNIPYPIEPNLWEGVYIDTVSITLPKPFKRVKESYQNAPPPPTNGSYPLPARERIRVSAFHLLLDETGVSGEFEADGQVPLIGGAIMDGEWGWSLDEVDIHLLESDITYFHFAGQIGIPLLSKDGPLTYDGSMHVETKTYTFAVGGIIDNATIPIWNAVNIDFYNEDPLLGVTIANEEFKAYVLFPKIGFVLGTEKDYINSQSGSKFKLPGVNFVSLKVSTSQPYISYESMTVQAGNSKLMDFPINLSAYKMVTPPGNPEQLNLEFTLDLNLMSQLENGVQAKGDLILIGDYKRDINGARHWVYRTLDFEGANIVVNLPQFYATGTLCIFDDENSVYKKGFYADLNARLIGDELENPQNKAMFNIEMMAIFGNTGGYKYFLVDGFVSGDAISVPLFGPYYLDGFGGGVFHNMVPDAYIPEDAEPPEQACSTATSTSGIVYVPNNETRLGFNFATSITTTGNLMNGLLTCIVRFDQSMALQNITLWGVASIMIGSKLTEKLTPPATELKKKVEDNALPVADLKAKNKNEASNPPPPAPDKPVPGNAIKANVGISMDFVNGFTVHGFAEVSIHVYEKAGQMAPLPHKEILTGRGTFDLLLSASKWHLFVGGYYPNTGGAVIKVPDFFNGNLITLQPVNVTVDYKDFKISANAYFLTGNDIPGPPPPAPEVVTFFGAESAGSNRDLLDCSPHSSASGTGIAFGASAFFDFTKFSKGLFGSCFLGLKVNVGGGAGFDLALLKYPSESSCGVNTGFSPHGMNGFRAGGRLFVFIDLEGKHVTCIPIPPLGVGLKIRFDVPNPSFFEVVAILKVGKELKFKVNIGDECGQPCISNVVID